ncbi:uncharacterized protein [Haliotis cracherodii]|uniref:uncharacterized protein n=1 Tax=Haliotis cracherodii TaxID=6455 RepID=UPI0039E81FFD
MDQAYTEVMVGHQKIPVHFKLDTGSKVNTIPASIFEAKSLQYPLKQANVKLQGYGGEYFKVKGQCNMKVYNRHSSMSLDFFIVQTKAPPVLSLRTCLDLKLVKLILAVDSQPSSSDEFQHRMDEINENLDGFNVIVDDIHIHGQSKEEHDRRLRAMLQRSSEKGIRMNPEKTDI